MKKATVASNQPFIFALLILLGGINQASANIVWTETYVGDGTTLDLSDVEGLASATFVLAFTSDSGPNYVDPFNAGVATITASSGTITISGSSVSANNGTFALTGGFGRTGTTAAVPNDGGIHTYALDMNGNNPVAQLPSGNILFFPTSRFTGGSVPAVGDAVNANDFGTTYSAPESGGGILTVEDSNRQLLWSQLHSGNASLSVSAVPEPSGLGCLALVSLAVCRIRRRRHAT